MVIQKKKTNHTFNALQGIVTAQTQNSPQPPSHSPLILSYPNCGCSHPTLMSLGRDGERKEALAEAENRPPCLPLKVIHSARRHQNGRWYSLSITFGFYLTSPSLLHLSVISCSLSFFVFLSSFCCKAPKVIMDCDGG